MWVCLWNIVTEHYSSFRVTVNVLRKRQFPSDLLLNCSRLVNGWTKTCIFFNQSNETKVNSSLFTRVFTRLAPSTLHQINLKAPFFLRSVLLFSLIWVNCPPKTGSFQSGWIWLQFKMPALRFSVSGKLVAERNSLKTLTSTATLRFQIYRHFLALLRQMCGRKIFNASVCTGPKRLKQTINAHSVLSGQSGSI